jgi:hypothetical protein
MDGFHFGGTMATTDLPDALIHVALPVHGRLLVDGRAHNHHVGAAEELWQSQEGR